MIIEKERKAETERQGKSLRPSVAREIDDVPGCKTPSVRERLRFDLRLHLLPTARGGRYAALAI
jgi:hypothetical protein